MRLAPRCVDVDRRRREPAPDPRRVSHAASSRSSIPTPPPLAHANIRPSPLTLASFSQRGRRVSRRESLHPRCQGVPARFDGSLGALAELTGHGAPVTDVSFPLPHEPWGALTSSDDGTTRYWDVRAPPQSRETSRYVAHFAKSHATATLAAGTTISSPQAPTRRSCFGTGARDGPGGFRGEPREDGRGFDSSPVGETDCSPRPSTVWRARSTAGETRRTSTTRMGF